MSHLQLFTVKEAYDDALLYASLMSCKKEATYFRAIYSSDSGYTYIAFVHGGTICEYGLKIRGNVAGLTPDQVSNHDLVVSSSESASAGGGLFTGFDIIAMNSDGESGKVLLETTGLAPITFTDFVDNVLLPKDPGASYQRLVSLLDDDTLAKGTKLADRFDTGGGNDTIKAKAGDDTVYKWKAGDLNYNGGKGSDGLVFEPFDGTVPNAPNGAVVDLTKGKGTNPFGGTLKLTDVENVAGVFGKNNDLRGNADDNFLLGGTAVDKLRGEGGDDTVHVKYWTSSAARPMLADGGKGHDTLEAELSDAPAAPFTGSGFNLLAVNTLDLLDPSKNTGTFHGGTFANFEVFQALGSGFEQFVFHGSNKGESVAGAGAGDILDGRGGKDLLDGGYGNDTLTGGGGKDTFFFRVRPDAGNIDTVTDFAAGDKIQLDGFTFNVEGKGKHGTGELNAKFFATGTAAHDKDDFILYDKASGTLFWDPDGNGKTFAPVQIAHFNGNPSLSVHDFIVA